MCRPRDRRPFGTDSFSARHPLRSPGARAALRCPGPWQTKSETFGWPCTCESVAFAGAAEWRAPTAACTQGRDVEFDPKTTARSVRVRPRGGPPSCPRNGGAGQAPTSPTAALDARRCGARAPERQTCGHGRWGPDPRPRCWARKVPGVSPASRRKSLTKLVGSAKPSWSPIAATGSTVWTSRRLASSTVRSTSTALALRSVTRNAARERRLAEHPKRAAQGATPCQRVKLRSTAAR